MHGSTSKTNISKASIRLGIRDHINDTKAWHMSEEWTTDREMEMFYARRITPPPPHRETTAKGEE